MQETIVGLWDKKLSGNSGVDGNGQIKDEETVKIEVAE